MSRYRNRRTMALAGAILVIAASLVAGAAPQLPQTESGITSVEGVVVDWGTRDPIAGVEVELTRVAGTDAFPLTAGTPATPAQDGPGPAIQGILAARLPPTPAADEVLTHAVTSDGWNVRIQRCKARAVPARGRTKGRGLYTSGVWPT